MPQWFLDTAISAEILSHWPQLGVWRDLDDFIVQEVRRSLRDTRPTRVLIVRVLPSTSDNSIRIAALGDCN